MAFSEIKKAINSDLTGDPVNCISYINSIESEGRDSYVLDKRNSNLWRELITNSITAFKIFRIHEIMYERFTDADIDYMVGASTTYQCRGGYDVTIDNTSVASCTAVSNNNGTNVTASDTHKFFTSNIGLTFTTGTASGDGENATGSGSMKYILGS